MGVLKNGVGRPSNEIIKKRNILKIVCVILVVIIIGLICYILNDKKVIKVSNDNNKVTEKSKVLDIESKKVKELYMPFTKYSYTLDEEELYKKDTVNVDDLSDSYKNRLAFSYLYNEVGLEKLYDGYKKMDESDDHETRYLKSNKLENSYKKLFGNKVNYFKTSFDGYNIDVMIMKYNKEDDCYYGLGEEGDESSSHIINEFYKAKQVDNKIELYEYVVFYKLEENNNSYIYKNLDDFNNNTNSICDKKEVNNCDLEVRNLNGLYDLSKYKNVASKYKLTFEKENNNYVFKRIEKVK